MSEGWRGTGRSAAWAMLGALICLPGLGLLIAMMRGKESLLK